MTYTSFFEEMRRYCDETGLSPSTVCLRAANNSRLPERIARRAERLDEDVERVRAYMAENPPGISSKAKSPNTAPTDAEATQ